MSSNGDLKADVLTIDHGSEHNAAGKSEKGSERASLSGVIALPPETSVTWKIEAIFREKLNVPVPSPTDDLFATGVLDSLGLVKLLAYLEEQFDLLVPIEDLDLESFRTLSTIADLVLSHGSEWKKQGSGPVAGPAVSEAVPTNG
jgi:acyl carrier protein